MATRAKRDWPGWPYVVLVLLVAAICFPVPIDGDEKPNRDSKLIAVPVPPMGWGSWNSFSNTIDSKIVMAQAKAIVDSGMKAAGYQYQLRWPGYWTAQTAYRQFGPLPTGFSSIR